MSVVAVSQRIDAHPKRDETRDSLDQRMISFLLTAGQIPVVVPNCLHKTTATGQTGPRALESWLREFSPGAILLSGGNDIGDFADRDETEVLLLDYAKRLGLPVLGICRGMQMLGHWAGTNLRPVKGHVGTRHRLVGELAGDVNSYHDNVLASCPNGFEVLARSEDGAIEAIRHVVLPWEGWMWHPEREADFSTHDLERVRSLFGANQNGEMS